jgi:C4-dicarboxylate-specific signal transduction histidine kinase
MLGPASDSRRRPVSAVVRASRPRLHRPCSVRSARLSPSAGPNAAPAVRPRRIGVLFRYEDLEEHEVSDALLIPIAAVATGVVVIVVAVAVVLVVLFVTVSMRGRQRRGVKRDETRHDLAEAEERAARAERDRDIAQEQAQPPHDPDR